MALQISFEDVFYIMFILRFWLGMDYGKMILIVMK